ncbi:hypothetical protein NMY22_g18087 [Coprinellus aureogranulatus]|nr:hypothetical protein NMY22_g18087 [Coprinellus aureogranulatus]
MLDSLGHGADYRARVDHLLRLALVCKMWNEEAHDSSHWSEVSIPIYRRTLDAQYKEVEPRFKGLRSVTIRDFDTCRCLFLAEQDACHMRNGACLELLSKYSSLRRLSLSLSCAQCFKNLVQSVMAEQGSGSRIPRIVGEEEEEFFDLEHLPPSLTSLSLSFPLRSWDPPGHLVVSFRLPLTLTKLTYLDFTCNWPTSIVLKTLQRCPSLEVLRLDYGKPPQRLVLPMEDVGEVVLPKVHTLDVSMTLVIAAQILQSLTLPALVNVRIGIYDDGEVCEKLNYIKALSSVPGIPAAVSLRSLTIYVASGLELGIQHEQPSEQQLMDAFSAIPSL